MIAGHRPTSLPGTTPTSRRTGHPLRSPTWRKVDGRRQFFYTSSHKAFIQVWEVPAGKPLVRLPKAVLQALQPGRYVVNVMCAESLDYEFFPVDLRSRLWEHRLEQLDQLRIELLACPLLQHPQRGFPRERPPVRPVGGQGVENIHDGNDPPAASHEKGSQNQTRVLLSPCGRGGVRGKT